MSREETHNNIAKRVAKELKAGQYVNLGIGLPTRVANYVNKESDIIFHSENGVIGLSSEETGNTNGYSIVNAGGEPVSIIDGGCFFDSATSFGIVRGGHLDVAVLGALQVDEKGNVANYLIPNKYIPGMGGAMDLLVGAKKVIIAMEHTAKARQTHESGFRAKYV